MKFRLYLELFEDEPIYEQYDPVLGENFIDYPVLEDYGVPTVEEIPDESPEEDDEGDEQDESDSTETEDKDKKEVIKHTGKRGKFILLARLRNTNATPTHTHTKLNTNCTTRYDKI